LAALLSLLGASSKSARSRLGVIVFHVADVGMLPSLAIMSGAGREAVESIFWLPAAEDSADFCCCDCEEVGAFDDKDDSVGSGISSFVFDSVSSPLVSSQKKWAREEKSATAGE
jgi:hypothetical protein